MPKLFKIQKTAFPQEKYNRRSHSVNRYWDAEDARRRPRPVRRRETAKRDAPQVIEVRMRRPAKVVRDRRHRPRKKLTPEQIVRLVIRLVIALAVAGAAAVAVFVIPNIPPVLLLRANYALENGEREKAKGLYARAVEKSPGNTDAVMSVAQLDLEDGEINETIRFLRAHDNGSEKIAALLAELVPTASLQPDGGVYTDFIRVSASSPREDVTIHYSADGSEVGPDSPVFPDSYLPPEGSTVLRILPVAENGALGDVTVHAFGIRLREPEQVSASPASGAYDKSVRVLLTTGNPDDIIRYTTDGTDPTHSSLIYCAPSSADADGGGILLGGGLNEIRAIAITPQGVASPVAAYTYDLTNIVPDPVGFDVEGGYFYGGFMLHLTTEREENVIYYTTNGLDPDPGSYYTYTYEDGIYLDVGFNAPIRAVAVSPEGRTGDIVQQGYTVRSAG